MPRKCTVCNHQKAGEINAALVGSESLRTIAGRWSVSKTALFRHKADHLPAAVVKAVAVEAEINGGKLLDRLMQLNRETALILGEARNAGTKDNQLALKAIARAEKQLELEGRLLGELNQEATIDITQAPEWQSLKSKIVMALEPYPEARQAVLGAIHDAGI